MPYIYSTLSGIIYPPSAFSKYFLADKFYNILAVVGVYHFPTTKRVNCNR